MNTIKPLNLLISLNECSGLNLQGDQSVSGLFGGGIPAICNSGDPEMIIIVKFKEKVHLNQILIEASDNQETHPSLMKLFANKDDLDFSDVESLPPTEAFKLEGNFGKKLGVRIPKFKNISELTIFFQNEQAEQIQVNKIKFFGIPGESNVNFAEMKKKQAEES